MSRIVPRGRGRSPRSGGVARARSHPLGGSPRGFEGAVCEASVHSTRGLFGCACCVSCGGDGGVGDVGLDGVGDLQPPCLHPGQMQDGLSWG